MSIWRIAAAVFVGNIVWFLIVFSLYLCFAFGIGILGIGAARPLR